MFDYLDPPRLFSHIFNKKPARAAGLDQSVMSNFSLRIEAIFEFLPAGELHRLRCFDCYRFAR